MADPAELVRWAETYGHPEEWAKKAQQLHADNERLREAANRVSVGDGFDGDGGRWIVTAIDYTTGRVTTGIDRHA